MKNDDSAISCLTNALRSSQNGGKPYDMDPSVRNSIENPELEELFDLVLATISKHEEEKKAIQLKDELETELDEIKKVFRLMTETSSDVIWIMDIATRKFSYISPSIQRFRGLSVKEAMNEGFTFNMLPDSAERAKHDFGQLLKKIKDKEPLPNIKRQYQLYRKDHRVIDTEVSFNIVYNEKGNPKEIIGISRDISDRIGTDKALKASEKQLAQLLAQQSSKNHELTQQLEYIYNNAQNSIALFKTDGKSIRFSSCNNRWASKIGYTAAELENFDISLMKDQETANLYKRLFLKALELKHPFEEFLYWHSLHLHIIVIPVLYDPSQDITTVASLVYDLTGEFTAKQQFLEMKERFISVFNNSKDAIVLLTTQLEIVEVNRSFFELYGSADFPLNNVVESYFPQEYHHMAVDFFSNLAAGTSIPIFECELYNNKKERVPVEISTSIITLEQKPMILCIIRDISMRKEMGRLMAKVGSQIETRERRKLAADLHDNVGPLLSSMNMYLSVLSRKEELKPYAETLSDIRRILKDAITSVREISNNLSPQVLQNFGLSAALDNFFETKQKLITIKINNTIGAIRFNELKENMIYNIIIEAFNNTLKHAGASSAELDLAIENQTMCLSYSDNGQGFDLEDKLKTSNLNLGIFNIINRVKILEGNYSIITAPGKGFLLKIVFPINH